MVGAHIRQLECGQDAVHGDLAGPGIQEAVHRSFQPCFRLSARISESNAPALVCAATRALAGSATLSPRTVAFLARSASFAGTRGRPCLGLAAGTSVLPGRFRVPEEQQPLVNAVLRLRLVLSARDFSARRHLRFPLSHPAVDPSDDAYAGFTCGLQTARLLPPRFAPGLSTTRRGFTIRDPGISPDRTHTDRPS